MTILKTPIPKTIITSILSFVRSRFQPKFNTSNTAIGNPTATLNELSGTITYGSGAGLYTVELINNKIKEGDFIVWNFEYTREDEEFYTQGGVKTYNGGCFFSLLFSGVLQKREIIIRFQKQN
jgi:hypothetical protein